MKKKPVIIVGIVITMIAVIVIGAVLVINNKSDNQNDSTNSNPEAKACYDQCEEWGGGSESVGMCKENCDASYNQDSVWNQDDDQYNPDDSTSNVGWPSSMPSEVPEFTYGSVTGDVSGMDSWIVDFENVQDNALEQYEADLESEGWTVSVTSSAGLLTGSYGSEYTISINHDKEYKTLQIIVRNAS